MHRAEVLTSESVKALLLELAHAPTWPSASRVALTDAKGLPPKLVCLDMKDWIALGRAYYGKSTENAPALASLKEAVAKRDIVLPVTSVNVMEVGAIPDDERRRRLASVMVELSGNHALVDHVAIRKRELHDALVSVYQGGSSTAPRAQMVRWGITNAAGIERIEAVGAPPHLQAIIDEVMHHPLSSEKALGELHSDENTRAGYEMDSLWCEAVEQVRRDTAHLSLREQLEFETLHTLREGRTAEQLRGLAAGLGIEREHLMAWLQDAEKRVAFMRRVPSLGIAFTLRRSRDPNPQHKMHRNDLRDLLYLSSTIPYADFVVTDRAWAHAATTTGVDRQYDTVVCRDLSELVKALNP